MKENKTTDKEYQFCLRCGRTLKNDKAMQLGYGQICLRKMKSRQKNRLFDPDISGIIE